MPSETRLRAAIRRRVRIDTRALAAVRVALGALLLADLALRSRDLVAFYTDAGVVPRAVLPQLAPTFGRLSLHAAWGSAAAQALLFLIAGLFALCLLVGYRTRLATVASLVLLVSLHVRNPAVLNGGDTLLRHLLLWGVLLPLGERWSVDAVGREGARETVASVASAGLLVQVVAVYATNAVVKLRGDRWLDGTAVEQVLQLTRFATPLGGAIADLPIVPTLLSYGWLALLVCAPLLVVLTGRGRAVLAGGFALGHLGMAVTMEIGLFPLISVAALLPFLPPTVWDRLPTPPAPVFERFAARLDRLPGWPRRLPTRLRSASTVLAAVLFCGMLVVNLASVGVLAYPAGTPAAVEAKGWDMFAPDPPVDDGWYVAPARLESGERINALGGGPLSWDRPPDVSATLPNNRWKKLFYQLRGGPEASLRRPLAESLCARWNRAHADDLEEIRLVYVEYSTRTDARGERVELGRFDCG